MNVETGIPALDTALVWGGAASILVGLLAGLWRGVRALARFFLRAGRLLDDFLGEPERPGVPARPGVMERIQNIDTRVTRVEHELYPNSGASLRDAIDLANRRLARLCPDQSDEGDGDLRVPPTTS
ncbi:hypothetical protein [Streptomyces sp. NPDC058548]|uniref:hypothetical protein n=1 Tax=Streptomyces sp. NPDC058548 TaxID=3346545 RepID=UPI003661FB70